MKAGIGDDPDAAFLNGNDGRAQRAEHLDALIATKIEFGEDFAATTDDGLLGNATLPGQRK